MQNLRDTGHGERPEHDLQQLPALRPHPSKLFVEVTTRCNLRCAMCPREAPGGAVAEGDMSAETFARLAPAFPPRCVTARQDGHRAATRATGRSPPWCRNR